MRSNYTVKSILYESIRSHALTVFSNYNLAGLITKIKAEAQSDTIGRVSNIFHGFEVLSSNGRLTILSVCSIGGSTIGQLIGILSRIESLILANFSNLNSRNNNIGGTIDGNNGILSGQNIPIAGSSFYPALRSDKISTTLESNVDIVLSCLNIIIANISHAEVCLIKDNGLTGIKGNRISVIRSRVAGSSRGINLYSHSHGANHDDSQYQCEYFFHCDFLL